MEDLETFILVAGSLAVACAFGWTATCKLMLLVASGLKRIKARGRPAISCIRDPLPAASTARHPAGLDDDFGVRRDDRRKAGLPVGLPSLPGRVWLAWDAARVSSGGPNKTRR